MKTRYLTTRAMLIAIYVVLALLSFKLVSIKVTFQAFPVLFAAIIFGPVDGMLVGGLGELVYQTLFSGYGFTVTTILWVLPHLLSGLVVGLLARKAKKLDVKSIATLGIISALIVTGLNMVAMYIDAKIFDYTVLLFASLPLKIVIGIIQAILFALVLPPLIERFKK